MYVLKRIPQDTSLQSVLTNFCEAQDITKAGPCLQVIASHAEPLITAMKFFIANVATLCEKTMEDTLWSINNLNAARVDYDGVGLNPWAHVCLHHCLWLTNGMDYTNALRRSRLYVIIGMYACCTNHAVLRLEREAQGLPLDDSELNSRRAKYEKVRVLAHPTQPSIFQDANHASVFLYPAIVF